jgi:hypothetical protein
MEEEREKRKKSEPIYDIIFASKEMFEIRSRSDGDKQGLSELTSSQLTTYNLRG